MVLEYKFAHLVTRAEIYLVPVYLFYAYQQIGIDCIVIVIDVVTAAVGCATISYTRKTDIIIVIMGMIVNIC